jgi:hypothetical protein
MIFSKAFFVLSFAALALAVPVAQYGPGSQNGPGSDNGPGSQNGPGSDNGPGSQNGPGSGNGSSCRQSANAGTFCLEARPFDTSLIRST